jgi:hypothetical protein
MKQLNAFQSRPNVSLDLKEQRSIHSVIRQNSAVLRRFVENIDLHEIISPKTSTRVETLRELSSSVPRCLQALEWARPAERDRNIPRDCRDDE